MAFSSPEFQALPPEVVTAELNTLSKAYQSYFWDLASGKIPPSADNLSKYAKAAFAYGKLLVALETREDGFDLFVKTDPDIKEGGIAGIIPRIDKWEARAGKLYHGIALLTMFDPANPEIHGKDPGEVVEAIAPKAARKGLNRTPFLEIQRSSDDWTIEPFVQVMRGDAVLFRPDILRVNGMGLDRLRQNADCVIRAIQQFTLVPA